MGTSSLAMTSWNSEETVNSSSRAKRILIVTIHEEFRAVDISATQMAMLSWIKSDAELKFRILVFSVNSKLTTAIMKDATESFSHFEYDVVVFSFSQQSKKKKSGLDYRSLFETSSDFARRRGCDLMLFMHPNLILPPRFFSTALKVFKTGDVSNAPNMAIGLRLNCVFEESLAKLKLTINTKVIESFAKSCSWHSVRISSYLFYRIDSQNWKHRKDSLDFWNISSAIDLSPILMPVQYQHSLNTGIKSIPSPTLLEAIIRDLTHNLNIADVPRKACPSLISGSKIRLHKVKKDEKLLMFCWIAGTQPWMSPFAQGLYSHARRLGCFGRADATQSEPLSSSVLTKTQKLGIEYLQRAGSHTEPDPDVDLVAKRIFPFNKINLDCEHLRPYCFVHKNGILMEGDREFLGKYRPLLTYILRNNMTVTAENNELGKAAPNFVWCVSGTDRHKLDIQKAKLGPPKTDELPTVPIFECSFCSDSEMSNPPDEGFSRFSHDHDSFNFLNFDHVYIAGGTPTSNLRYPTAECLRSFDNRNEVITFRGTITGYHPRELSFAEEFERVALIDSGRFALVMWSQSHPELVDAMFSTFEYYSEIFLVTERLKEENAFNVSRIPPTEYFCNFQSVLVLRGFGAAFRLVQHFKSGQCVFLQHSDCFEWFYQYLKPWIHYVPFRGDLSDLEQNIQIVKHTPGLARTIAHNGRIFYDKYLSWDAIVNVTVKILGSIHDGTECLNDGKPFTFKWYYATKMPHYKELLRCTHLKKEGRIGICRT
jgi:hypothetical protein